MTDAETQKVTYKATSVDEVIARITQENLSSLPFFDGRFEVGMAEGFVYSVESDGHALLRVTRKETNPLNYHHQDFVKSVYQNRLYPISPSDFDKLKIDPSTVVIDLEKLSDECDGSAPREKRFSAHLGCTILTKRPFLSIGGYNSAGRETRKLAKSLFGQENNFGKTMELFQNYEIKEILLQVVSPHFVAKYVTQTPTVFAAKLSINRIRDNQKMNQERYRICVTNYLFYPSNEA